MLRINVTNTKKVMSEMGVALAPISIPIGMIIKLTLDNMILGNVLMALGILMMFPYHRLREGIKPNLQLGVVFFMILSFVYYIFSEFDESVYLLYLGVTLVYSLGLSLSKYEIDFRFDQVMKYMWIFSLICVLGGVFCFATGILTVIVGLMDFNEEGDTIYDGLTMGSVAITQIICSFYFVSKEETSQTSKFLLFFIILVDVVLIVMAFKRTPILVALIVIIYYLRRLGYLSMTPKKVIGLVVVLIGIALYIINSPEVNEALGVLFEETVDGISNLLMGSHTGNSLTNSTDMRLDNREIAFRMIADFDMLEYQIGAGFMTFWFDMPLIQAYLDMGVIGILLYGIYTVYIPFNALFTKKKENAFVLACAMFSLYGAITCLSSGHPYSHTLWMPICLLCYAISGNKSMMKE